MKTLKKLRLKPRSDLREWMERMGFNGHQVTLAGGMIGMEGNVLSLTRSGERDLTLAERLAMTAVRAGLKPWSPEYDDELMAATRAPREAIAS